MEENRSILKYRTRGNSNPRGKAKAYFSYHQDDFVYFEHICQLILNKQDCAIYYYDYSEGEPDPEELKLLLNEMQLFIVPVTSNYLFRSCNAYDMEFHFAMEKHIPILPLLQNNDLEFKRQFSDKCNKIQYLDEYDTNDTKIPFDQKLENFLSATLLNDEQIKKVQAAFDAHIFLSYRKKDREEANKLMGLIHSDEALRDIAIWYDEFLATGVPFDESIQKALKDCSLFALLVTPNLLEDNYILREEFPMAKRENKEIIPAERVKTDIEKLEKMYDAIPRCLDVTDGSDTSEFIKRLKKIATKENNTPEHNFLIGLAYLMGIDVEKNTAYALSLITGAAEAGLVEAMKKLVQMYYSGVGTQRDLLKAIDWQEKLVEKLSRKYDEEKDEAVVSELMVERNTYAKYCEEASLIDRAETAYKENTVLCEEMTTRNPERYKGDLARSYINIGSFYDHQGKAEEAEKYYKKAVEIMEELSAQNPGRYKGDLATSYNNIGSFYDNQGKAEEAEKYYKKAVEIREELSAQNHERYKGNLASSYNNIGLFYDHQGKAEEAEKNYKKAVEIREELTAQNPERYRGDLASSYNNIGLFYDHQGKAEEAEKYYKKAVELMEELTAQNPERYKGNLARSYNNIGVFYYQQGKGEEAEKYFIKAVELSEELSAQNPERYKGGLAGSYNNIGSFYKNQGKAEEAEKYYKKAVEIREELSAQNPERYKGDLAGSYNNIGIFYYQQGKREEAEKYFIKAVELREELTAQNPERYKGNLATSYNNIGLFYKNQGKAEEAEKYYKKAIEIQKELADKDPDRDKKNLEIFCKNIVAFYKSQGRPEEAEKYLKM